MAVTKATLRTAAWDVIYTYLQTTNPISTNNIFSSMNSTLVESKGYPIVIIEIPSASIERLALDVTDSSNITMLFEVYDDNSADTKTLVDEILDKLVAGRDTFETNGLMNMEISEGGYDTWEEGRKKIHVVSFEVSFMFAA